MRIKTSSPSLLLFGLLLLVFLANSCAEATTVRGSIQWSATVATTTETTFGTNDNAIADPTPDVDPLYHQLLQSLGLQALRFHAEGITDAWTNSTTKTWNKYLVSLAYSGYSQTGLPALVIQTIPTWPSWMLQDANGALDPSEFNNYATLCAELVQIVNIELNQKVKYWEPFNEKQDSYSQHGILSQLWTIYNLTAIAMKQVDPTIMVGGPVMDYDDQGSLASFMAAVGSQADFISWHNYATLETSPSLATVFNFPPSIPTHVERMRALAQGKPLFLDEYNIYAAYFPSGFNLQTTYIGAVFMASCHKYLAESGVNVSNSWNAKDSFYGLIPYGVDTVTLSGQVFNWTNHHFIGSVANTSVSNSSIIDLFAVTPSQGSYSLYVINKLNSTVEVSISADIDWLSTSSGYTVIGESIDIDGYNPTASQYSNVNGTLTVTLQGCAVLFLRSQSASQQTSSASSSSDGTRLIPSWSLRDIL